MSHSSLQWTGAEKYINENITKTVHSIMKNCHFLLAQTLTSKQKAMPLFRNSSQHHSWYHLPKSELVCKFTSALTQSQPFFKFLEARKKIIICNRNLLLYLKNNGLNVEL